MDSSTAQGQEMDTQEERNPSAGLKCPRCDSTNTKLCYFNNYNLSQPRHFCKSCRRYWTRRPRNVNKSST